MCDSFFSTLETLTDSLWFPVGVCFVLLLGLYLSIRARFVQFRKFPTVINIFISFLGKTSGEERGIHPLKAMFAALGGCIGLGNVVAIVVAVQLGGPGSLFWVWVAGFMGMVIKYSEVYLGMIFRVRNEVGSYDGGPMYYMRKAFNARWVVPGVCVLLCLYGVEVFMYNAMTESISHNWHINKYLVAGILLVLVLLAGSGGVQRVGNLCSTIVPLFLVLYSGMALWVLLLNLDAVPSVFEMIFRSAFTGHAAIGGFAGASVMAAIGQGIAKGCYSGDIAIGYASVIHSESSTQLPAKQASLTILAIFLDTFVVCSTSVILVLITGTWREDIPASLLVQHSLGLYFPYMNFFMPFFLFLLGYSTMIAYFCVGLKCAHHISQRWGKKLYYIYTVLILATFSIVGSPESAFIVMSLVGVCLLFSNMIAIFKLRHHLSFDID